MSTNTDAAFYVQSLSMNKHPEGGYYKEIFRSSEQIPQTALPARFNGDRSFSTAIYYLLEKEDKSHLHKIDADEMWFFLDGSPLLLHYINESGEHITIRLCRPESGEGTMFAVIPHGLWFCAEPENKESYSLVSCVVTPGFDFNGFFLGSRTELLKSYPNLDKFILKFTR